MPSKIHPVGTSRSEVSGLPPCIHCGKQIGPGEPYVHEEDDEGSVKVRHAVPLYFDECALATRDMLVKLGFCVVPSLPRGAPDTEWLAKAGDSGWIVITQDSQITRREDELATIARHKVKCFILPARNTNRWDQIRGFVQMWDKIRIESFYSGPFVWKFNDESQLSRWELAYPKALEFAAYDLSTVPVGHLLNLFADVVGQHDQGWFSFNFVDQLHHNIRTEIEARISGDRSGVPPPAKQGELLLSFDYGPDTEGRDIPLEKAVDASAMRLFSVVGTVSERESYIWLIPAQKVAANLVGHDDSVDDAWPHQISLTGKPMGFQRSGFGLIRRRIRKRRRRPA